MQEKIDELDLWKAKAFEFELETARTKAEAVMQRFQAHLDAIWAKYNLVQGKDEVLPDGTIKRGE